MTESFGMTGVGKLNFTSESEAGNTPAIGGGNSEIASQTQAAPPSSLCEVTNSGPPVTVTPSTPLPYTPSPASGLQTGNLGQRGGVAAMPPPLLRPKPKKTFTQALSSPSTTVNSSIASNQSPPTSMFSKRLNLMSLMSGESCLLYTSDAADE